MKNDETQLIPEEDWGFMDDLYCRDPEEALLWYGLAARQGDVHAQSALGDLFWDAKRWNEAATCYREAAKGGHTDSQVMLGHMIYSGMIPQDLAEMVHWYFLASDKEWIARFMMGECYRHGRGLPQSYDKAIWWFLRGDIENAIQRRRLEACCAFYNTAPSQYSEAYAIENGKADVSAVLGGREMWKDMKPDQLAEGLRRLTEYEADYCPQKPAN